MKLEWKDNGNGRHEAIGEKGRYLIYERGTGVELIAIMDAYGELRPSWFPTVKEAKAAVLEERETDA